MLCHCVLNLLENSEKVPRRGSFALLCLLRPRACVSRPASHVAMFCSVDLG